MQIELKSLQKQLGISFVYVTHDQEEALTMSDRIAVMSAGRIEQIGAAREIYESPVNEFVADFIGLSNIIEGTIVDFGDGSASVRVDGTVVKVRTASPLKTGASEQVRIMVRPEKITLAAGEGEDGVRGRIESGTYLGESTRWVVKLQTGQQISILEQNSGLSGDVASRIGEKASVRWEPDSAVILQN